jgi:D-lactate dehydrogenase (cytochrome)
MIIRREPEVIQPYLEDMSNLRGGYAEGIVFPEDETAVSQFFRDIKANPTPVTISGGGTGVTGARVPFGGIILATDKLKKVLKIERASSEEARAILQPGVTIEELEKEASAHGLMYPVAPTEKSAFIGGTVSTNATGARSVKYGATREFVQRLRIVFSTGDIAEITRGTSRVKGNGEGVIPLLSGEEIKFTLPHHYRTPKLKNAAGYYAQENMDVIEPFIGQEGTLGVITEIEVKLVKKPKNWLSCFIFLNPEIDLERIIKKIKLLKTTQEIHLSSFEYFDYSSLELLREKYPQIPQKAHAAFFLEFELFDENSEGKLLEVLEKILNTHTISEDNVWLGLSASQHELFKQIRHALPEGINEIIKKNKFPKVSLEPAVPDNKLGEMLRYYSSEFTKTSLRYFIFGHIGENHLHVNIIPKNETELQVSRKLCQVFSKKAVELGGTISGEHGVGKLKFEYLKLMYSQEALQEMLCLKYTFDPGGILGRGNIFPVEMLSP